MPAVANSRILGLTAVVLLGLVSLLIVVAVRTNEDSLPPQTPNAALESVPDKWKPLFQPNPEIADSLALARRIDSSFDPGWLHPWAQGVPASAGSDPGQASFFLIFNEVCENLRYRASAAGNFGSQNEDLGPEPGELAEQFAEIFSDEMLHSVTRDYVAQHLALLAEARVEALPITEESFISALENPERFSSATLGTVVNSFQELSKHHELSNSSRMGRAISELLAPTLKESDNHLDLTLRTALLQSASKANSKVYLPVLREIAANPDQPEGLRIAAVGSIGRIGSTQDLALLRTIQQEGSFASEAAVSAIHQLSTPQSTDPS
ncbi:MAG: hypothetical protein AAGI48_13500 [Verrucomicrobiota bacterium]